MMYLSYFQKFLTFSMSRNQSADKMVANNGQLKLTIHDVWTIFSVNTQNA